MKTLSFELKHKLFWIIAAAYLISIAVMVIVALVSYPFIALLGLLKQGKTTQEHVSEVYLRTIFNS